MTNVAETSGGANTSFDVTVTGMSNLDTVIASLAAGEVTDAAGNPNVASTSVDNEVTYNALTPGNVSSDLRLWLRADAGVANTGDGTAATTWADQSGRGNDAVSDGFDPVYDAGGGANFNPTVSFDGNQYLRLPTGTELGLSGLGSVVQPTVFAVVNSQGQSNFAAGQETILGVDNRAGGDYHFTLSEGNPASGNHRIVIQDRANSEQLETLATIPGNEHHIAFGTNDATDFFAGFDAQTPLSGRVAPDGSVEPGRAPRGFDGTKTYYVGNLENGGAGIADNDTFNGVMSEVILFNGFMDPASVDYQQVQSYLGLKYGISLDAALGDYRDSTGTSVFGIDAAFGNAIAGLGFDSGSGLDQRIARSESAGTVLTVATDNDFTSANGGARTQLVDGQYLVWGHDGDAVTEVSAATLGGTDYELLDRVWKYTDTGAVGAVNLSFDVSALEFGNGTPQLVLSTDATIDGADTLVSGTVVGNTIQVTGVDLADDATAYFALAVQEAPTVALSASTTPILEAGATVDIAAALNAPSNLDVSVDLDFLGDATFGIDYTLTAGTDPIVIASGNSSGAVTLTASEDALLEGDETIQVDIVGVTNGIEGSGDGAGVETESVTITDNESATVTLVATDASAAEAGSDPGEFTVDLGTVNNTGGDITVNYAFGASTARTPNDYSPLSGSVAIAAGAQTATIPIVGIFDDNLLEGDETVTVNLTGTSLAGVGVDATPATVTITDNDSGVLEFGTFRADGAEPASSAFFVLQITSGSSFDVAGGGINATYTMSGSATSGTDFTPVTGTVRFTEVNQPVFVTVAPIDDALLEGDETVVLTLTGTDNASVTVSATEPSRTQVIADDEVADTTANLSVTTQGDENGEVAIVYTVELVDGTGAAVVNSSGSAITFDVSDTLAGSATPGTDYGALPATVSIAPGASSGTFTVAVTDDAEFENAETVVAQIANPSIAGINLGTATATASIADDDNAAGSVDADLSVTTQGDEAGPVDVVYTVTLSTANNTGSAITFDLDATGGTALAGDYDGSVLGTGVISVADGATTGTLTVPVIDDALIDNDRTLELTLSNPSDTAVTVNTASATATIADDDNVAGAISADLSVTQDGDEAGPTAVVYTVTLDQANTTGAAITFDLNATGGTALAGDYDGSVLGAGVISVADGATTGTLTVPVIDDALVDNDRTLEATLANPSDAAVTVNTATATATIADDDNVAGAVTATLSVTQDGDEAGTTGITYTVTLDAPNSTGGDLIFGLSDAGTGSATAGSDHAAIDATTQVVVTSGSTTGSVTLAVIDDNVVEPTETVVATLTSSSDPAVGLDATPAVANLSDDDAAQLTIAATTAGASEPGTDGQFTVSLSQPSATDTVVSLSYAGAASAGDYTAPASVTIAAGSTSATVDVAVLDDNIIEGNETVVATLDTVTVGETAISIGAASSATVTIGDDDTASVSLSVSDPGAAESPADAGEFTVNLTQPNGTGAPITVNYTVTGSATNGTDFATLSGTVDIADGASSATIVLTPVDDALFEGAESVELTLTSTSNTSVTVDPRAATARLDIADDEAAAGVRVSVAANDPAATEGADPGQFTLSLSTPNNTGSDIIVSYAIGGSADNGSDFAPLAGTAVIADGASSVTVDVAPVDDSLLESAETVIVTVTGTDNANVTPDGTAATATVTIADDETASGITASIVASDGGASEGATGAPDDGEFTVQLSAPNATGAPIVVSYGVSGTATPGADYAALGGSVSVPDGAQSATIAVTAADDGSAEPDETVIVTLTGTDNAAVTPAAAPADSATVTISDDELAAGVLASVSANDASAAESPADAGQFTVTLSAANGTGAPIDVSYTVAGSATAGSDYAALSGSVSIPDGATSAVIDVSAIDDGLLEGDEDVQLTLTGTSEPGFGIDGAANVATLTIADDESVAGAVTVGVAASQPAAAEAATPTAGQFTISLSAPNSTGSDIAVSFTLAGTASSGDYVATPAGATIADGANQVTVDVTPVDDALFEGTESVVLTVTGTSIASVGVDTSAASATVEIADDEFDTGTTVGISATDAAAAESPIDPGTFTVTLGRTNDTGAPIVVTYSVAGAAIAANDYDALPGRVEILPGDSSATVTVTPIDDALTEVDETVVLTLTGTDSAAVSVDAAADSASVAISSEDTGGIAPPNINNTPDGSQLTGTAEPGSTVTLTDGTGDPLVDGGGNPIVVTADPDGQWTATGIAPPLADGTTVTATSTDDDGNSSSVTKVVNVGTGDTTPPEAPNINNTPDGTQLTGTGEPGSTITLTGPDGTPLVDVGGNPVTATVDPNGEWSVSGIAPPLTDGTDVTATSTDAAGNSSSATETVRVATGDTTPPPAPNINNTPDGTQLTGTGEPGSTITLAEPDGTPLVDVGGNPVTATVDPNGEWSVSGIAPPLTDGTDVTATSTDAAGNSSSTTETISIGTGDTTPPPAPNINNTPDGTQLTGTGEPGTTITLAGPDGTPLVDVGGNPVTTTVDPNGEWSVSGIAPPLTDGADVTATSTDAAGNSSSATETISVGTGDTTPPEAPNINNTPDGSQLTGTGEPGSTITLTGPDGTPLVDAGGNPVTTTVDPDGEWSVTGIAPPLTDGTDVTATSTDAAGNSSSTTETISVGTGDTTPPEAPNINNTPDGSQLTGTGEPGSTITLTGPDGTPLVDVVGNPVAATIDPNGEWSVSGIAPPLTDGTDVTATSTDAAGNSSSTTETISVGTGDTTPPEAPNINNTPDGSQLTGTGEPGTTIALAGPDGTPLVDVGGNPVTATVDPNGEWSVSGIAPPLTDGTDVTATSTDAAGNSSSTTETVRVASGDTTPPLPPTVNNTPDGDELTGTAEPDSTVTLTNPDGTPLVDSNGDPITTTADSDGNWSVDDIDPDLTDGQPILVTSTDPSGNASSITATPNVGTGDTTPPLPPTVNNTPDGDELTGTGEPGGTITVTGPDGTPLVDSEGNPITTTVDPDGNWSVDDIDPDLTDGGPVTVTVTDPSGNSTSTTATPNVGTGDTTPPLPPTVNNTPDGDELTGTGEPGGTITLTGPDGTPLVDSEGNPITTTVDPDGNWSVDDIDPDLTDGGPVTVTVTDPAGNSTSITATPNVGTGDTTPPRDATGNNTPSGDELTGVGEPGSVITVTDEDGNPLRDSNGNPVSAVVDTDGNWRITDIDPDLVDGQRITIISTDPAGNSTSAGDVIRVDAGDTTPPAAPGLDGIGSTGELTGSGEPGSTITLYDADGNPLRDGDGNPVSAVVSPAGTWTVTGVTPTLQVGDRIIVVSTDAAGNSRSLAGIVDNAFEPPPIIYGDANGGEPPGGDGGPAGVGDGAELSSQELVLLAVVEGLGTGSRLVSDVADSPLPVLTTVESYNDFEARSVSVAPRTGILGAFGQLSRRGDSLAISLTDSSTREFVVPAAADARAGDEPVRIEAALLLGTQFYGGALYLDFEYRPATGSSLVATVYEVSLADGTPLPAWLSLDTASGTLSGMPPVDVDELELRVLVRLSDGDIVERLVTVSAATGDIIEFDIVASAATPGVLPFSEQVANAADAFDKEAQALASALA